MTDFLSALAMNANLSDDASKKAGQAGGTDMPEEHKKFLASLIAKIDSKEIDPFTSSSLLDQAKYTVLPEMTRARIDVSVLNMASQIQKIEGFFRNKATPNASPELKTMIEHLWEAKKRLEEQHGPLLRF